MSGPGDDIFLPDATALPPEPPPPPGGLWGLLKLWFGLTLDVNRRAYILSGFGLMLFKYAVEATAVYELADGRWFTPLDFLNPLISVRAAALGPPAPTWLPWVIFFWTLPFLWICVTMSVRRSAGAGATGWLGLLVLVPFVNYVWMLTLCALPQRRRLVWPAEEDRPQLEPLVDAHLRSALIGVAVSLIIAFEMLAVGVYVLKDYGVTLFLLTPVMMGASSAVFYNRPRARTLVGSLAVAQLSILITGLAMLLFAFEGVICLAMLYPFAAVLGLLGGFIGYMLGVLTQSPAATVPWVLLLLPALAGAESLQPDASTLFEVQTTVEIDAPPERVWPHVIGFADLPEPDPWYFKLGIAYPKRATIFGSGVGAVRHCEFSTGPFVEPITAWEPGTRLAFDVESQPPPMHELSPYRHVHPPHLDGYLRCRRGEFRLIPLAGGRTRLEGSTWYEMDMHPQDYWTLWSDLIIHRIHGRVLQHIKGLAEAV